MKDSARLIQRLRAVLPDLPEAVEFRRTYASASARAAGAWSWWLHDPTNPGRSIGSQWPVGTLLAAPEWDVSGPDRYGDVNIDPKETSVPPVPAPDDRALDWLIEWALAQDPDARAHYFHINDGIEVGCGCSYDGEGA